MEITVKSTDEEIIDFMKTSTSVKDWNSKRDQIKFARDSVWIMKNIDGSGLIVQILGKDEER